MILLNPNKFHQTGIEITYFGKQKCLQVINRGNISRNRIWSSSGGLLTPLTFAWHHLSPLAAFTFGAYFLHSGQQWQWICTASFKGIFGGPLSECVWQQAITCCSCYRMPQNAFFPQTCDLLISQKTMQTLLFHPPSTFPGNFCDCNSGGICTALQF